ncbi:uncharacterized protein LOC134783471 [Penaeus indicus]|uniref:uncharacterized protein LOC134783471 n=1 Tax=Penaeus indicus TaxID=29960 RepID=UPI00300D01D4
MTPQNKQRHLSVLSANVRGLRTNIGELTHMALNISADIIVATETFLNAEVEPAFGKIRGYSQWQRRDRTGKNFGGVAVCYKENLQIQLLTVDLPDWLEAIFMKVMLKSNESLLLCAHYRPQWQGRAPMDFLTENLDVLQARNNCQHLLIVGDLNHHLIQSAYEDLLTVHGLTDYVDFPTHILGRSLDPVISDLTEDFISCSSLGNIGTSDHLAVVSHLCLAPAADERRQRKIWLWNHANWPGMKAELQSQDWDVLLVGNANDKASSIASLLTEMQEKYVPSRTYITKPGDQAWFGYRCHQASKKKYRLWQRYKANPTRHNKHLYKNACKEMTATCKWARNRWQEDTKRKLSTLGAGSKEWWSLVKEHQGETREPTMPPLTKPDGTTASSNREKANLLGSMFSCKMTVPDANRAPPEIPSMCHEQLPGIQICRTRTKEILQNLNTKKAPGSDDISPHILRSKVFEKIIAEQLMKHLENHNLISARQFGFRSSRSTADLLLLLSKNWQDALDAGQDTLVIALDIAGAFDRVWHRGLLAKLQARGISSNLLRLFDNYLTGRTLKVVIGGQSSQKYPVEASVPQGSVLGPILWNIYIDDMLREDPEINAYADDCTLSVSYQREDHDAVATNMNSKLQAIYEWGSQWQIRFAPNKTQAMVISRSPAASGVMKDTILMNNTALPLEDLISVLGIDIDSGLRFNRHVSRICKTASLKVTALRRISHLLNPQGILTLYKSQIRPHLEYASQHQRTFSARVARLWNAFTSTIDVAEMTTQQVKAAAHRWRSSQPSPLNLLHPHGDT